MSNQEEMPDWLHRFLEKRLSALASTKPYDRYFFELLADRELTPTDKLVGVIIWKHANREGQDAWPGQELIAWLLGRGVETVRQSTRKLEMRGFLSTIPGKNQRSSSYTLRVSGRTLAEIPKRTLDELAAIFHLQTVQVPPPNELGGHPQTDKGGSLPVNLPQRASSYTAVIDGAYTTGVVQPSSGMNAGKVKRQRRVRHGKAMFDFTPEERTLEAAMEAGNVDDTEDVADAEIVETIQRATAGKVGKALLSEDGVLTVRMMMAALMVHTDCDAQTALEHIQRKVWRRIGQHPHDRLNCFSLIFKPICAALHIGDCDLVPGHEQRVAPIYVGDYAQRIHPRLYTEDGVVELDRLIERHGEAAVMATVMDAVTAAGNSGKERHGIRTWSYFDEAVEEHIRREQLRAAGIAPGDVCGLGMKMDVPF